jgi:hypothetical protein
MCPLDTVSSRLNIIKRLVVKLRPERGGLAGFEADSSSWSSLVSTTKGKSVTKLLAPRDLEAAEEEIRLESALCMAGLERLGGAVPEEGGDARDDEDLVQEWT